MHLTPACGASESETIVRSKGLLTQMLSDEPVMPRELDFYRKGPQKCLRGRPTARYSNFNLGRRHCRTASAAKQEEVNASSVQLSGIAGVQLNGWGSTQQIQL